MILFNSYLPFYILLTISSTFFLWGTITLLTAKKDPLKTARGNKILIWTIAGFLIILFSLFIINLLINFFEKGGGQPEIIENPDVFPPAPSVTSEFPPPPENINLQQ